jgi:hypothetical protein
MLDGCLIQILKKFAKEFPGEKRILIVELNGVTAYILGT